MFLKTELFDHNGKSVTLSELSALQRLDYLAWLKEKEELGDLAKTEQQALEMIIREGCMLIAMSLWHHHKLKGSLSSSHEEISKIQQEVLASWPVEAISSARSVVVRLSGMSAPVDDKTGKQEESIAEPVTVKKHTKAS